MTARKHSETEPVAEALSPDDRGSEKSLGARRAERSDCIDSELFHLTMAVVAEMWEMADEYLAQEGYKYVPRRRRRSVRQFDSGWPNVGLRKEEDSVIAYGELFAMEPNSIHPLGYTDIPSMGMLHDYVRGNRALLDRVSLPAAEGVELPDEVGERLLNWSICNLPVSIYDRAMALRLKLADPSVDDLYLQRERSWLAPTLPYQLVAPLVLTDIAMPAQELVIDDGASIVALTDDELRSMAQDYEVAGVPSPLADAARYAVVVNMPAMDNPGEGKRRFLRHIPIDTSRVDAVCDALRIVSSARPGWARLFQRPLGWASRWEDDLPNLIHVHTARRYPPEMDDRGWLRRHTPVTFEQASLLPTVVLALQESSPQARLASRRLSMARLRDAPDDQLIDACIGLESLLGQKGAEISYRIAVRAAALLACRQEDPRDPEMVFRAARKVYDRRSEIVHGSVTERNSSFAPHSGAEPLATHVVAVWLLREVLQQRLLRAHWTVEDLDAQVLRGLAPTAPVDLDARAEEDGGGVGES